MMERIRNLWGYGWPSHPGYVLMLRYTVFRLVSTSNSANLGFTLIFPSESFTHGLKSLLMKLRVYIFYEISEYWAKFLYSQYLQKWNMNWCPILCDHLYSFCFRYINFSKRVILSEIKLYFSLKWNFHAFDNVTYGFYVFFPLISVVNLIWC